MEQRDERERRIEQMIALLKVGTVIVEGSHDLKAMDMLGIKAIPYERIVSFKEIPDPDSMVYIMVDNDKGGGQKSEKIISALLTMDKRYSINTDVSKKLLKMLNLTSMEQIYGPIDEMRKRGQESDYYGKNISGDSKVHG